MRFPINYKQGVKIRMKFLEELREVIESRVEEFKENYGLSQREAQLLLARVLNSTCLNDELYTQADFILEHED